MCSTRVLCCRDMFLFSVHARGTASINRFIMSCEPFSGVSTTTVILLMMADEPKPKDRWEELFAGLVFIAVGVFLEFYVLDACLHPAADRLALSHFQNHLVLESIPISGLSLGQFSFGGLGIPLMIEF